MHCMQSATELLHYQSVDEYIAGRFIIQAIICFAWWFIKTPDGFQNWYGDGMRMRHGM